MLKPWRHLWAFWHGILPGQREGRLQIWDTDGILSPMSGDYPGWFIAALGRDPLCPGLFGYRVAVVCRDQALLHPQLYKWDGKRELTVKLSGDGIWQVKQQFMGRFIYLDLRGDTIGLATDFADVKRRVFQFDCELIDPASCPHAASWYAGRVKERWEREGRSRGRPCRTLPLITVRLSDPPG